MRLLIIHRSFALVGGAERVITDKANYLAKAGHQLMLVSYEQGTHSLPYELHPSVQYRDLNCVLAEVNLLEGITESFDMNWFSEVPSNIPLSEVEQYARNYWGQKQTDNPVIEVLFQGKYAWEEDK